MEKISDRCFGWFPAAMLVPIRMGTTTWRLHTNPYKFRLKTALHILRKKKLTRILTRVLTYLPSSFPRLLTFYFDLF